MMTLATVRHGSIVSPLFTYTHPIYTKTFGKDFLVKETLPNVTFPVPRSFAGNVPVNRAGPNNTLFFYAFEKSHGSLTAQTSDEPIYVDQPVGTGYATADAGAYAVDEDQVGTDFMGFLSNLAQIFPSLKSRPFHLIGESYAGIVQPPSFHMTCFTLTYISTGKFIPYIVKTYFGLPYPPVNLTKFAIGDGTIAAPEVYAQAPVISTLQTYPQLINFDPSVFEYFVKQAHLCKLDINLSYPQSNPIPTIVLPVEAGPEFFSSSSPKLAKQLSLRALLSSSSSSSKARSFSAKFKRRGIGFNRFISEFESGNDTINPWYGCDLYDEMIDYALNFTFPWFSFKEIRVHPSNATARGVSWIIYSGNDDSLDAHMGSLRVSYNTTFGGIRGFTRPPSTPWLNDDGSLKGIVHQERNLTYVLFNHASHQVPIFAPQAALEFVHDFLLGHNPLGSVIQVSESGQTTVIGGENTEFAGGILPGATNPIYYGSASTQFSTFWPSATISAWDNFISTANIAIATVTVLPT
ncbi:hypothetical protein Clacol_000853 [Clathrus columnatus]|uniref:Carboxypeptidase n=1 Tax=Clathrus columnatus TaxID=1419009 RepID=A0AAV5A1Y9_9AGAM|nr:hypothetical protein Clacol_000853 [Clathrus columnatus]